MKSSNSLANIVLAFLITSSLISCKQETTSQSAISKEKPKQQKTIVIQPYSDLDKSQADFIISEVKKVCPKVVVNKPIPLPVSAYYAANKRFRADSIIAIQKRICQNKKMTLDFKYIQINVQQLIVVRRCISYCVPNHYI